MVRAKALHSIHASEVGKPKSNRDRKIEIFKRMVVACFIRLNCSEFVRSLGIQCKTIFFARPNENQKALNTAIYF